MNAHRVPRAVALATLAGPGARPALDFGTANPFAGVLDRAKAALARWRASSELSQLSDRDLEDIGLTRDTIAGALRQGRS
jgi:uncharacterized protein YjiS (DUF1127 family)